MCSTPRNAASVGSQGSTGQNQKRAEVQWAESELATPAPQQRARTRLSAQARLHLFRSARHADTAGCTLTSSSTAPGHDH